MSSTSDTDRVFPALLRFWRGHRGFSQLDLGLRADVSTRHISFLETGRSRPSVEMVGLLAETLDVPLRDRNDMLRAAGYQPLFAQPTMEEVLAGPIGSTIEPMLRLAEPYPMMVLDRLFRVIQANREAWAFLALLEVGDEADLASDGRLSLLDLTFGSSARGLIANWDELAASLLRRLQAAVLHHPQDQAMADLLGRLMSSEGLPTDWRTLDPIGDDLPVIPLQILLPDGRRLSFMSTITSFSSPRNVALAELELETMYPTDDTTAAFCQQLADDGDQQS